jgi:hypothetical protein
MHFIKKNKEIFIQIIVFSIIAIFLKKHYLFPVVLILILLLPFQTIATKYIYYLNKTITLLGFSVKTILFTFLFVFVICPISLFKKQDKNTAYIIKNKIMEKSDFEKMW